MDPIIIDQASPKYLSCGPINREQTAKTANIIPDEIVKKITPKTNNVGKSKR